MTNNKYDEIDAEIADMLHEAMSVETRKTAIANGNDSASLAELLAGWPLRGYSVEIDAKAWANRLLKDQEPPSLAPPLPPSVVRALGDVARSPDQSNLERLRTASKRRRHEWNRDYIDRLVECEARADVYLWYLEDRDAAKRCALHALTRCNMLWNGLRPHHLISGLSMTTELSIPTLRSLMQEAVVACELKIRAGTTQSSMRQWLDQYQEHKRAADSSPPDDEHDSGTDDEITLLDAVIDDRDRGEWAYAPAEKKTLIVVPKLDHLPKQSHAQIERRDGPKGAIAGIEGVPLPIAPSAMDVTMLMLQLSQRFSWADNVIETLLLDISIAPEAVAFAPTILVGEPGCGKSTLLLELSKLVGLPATLYNAGGASDASILGTSRQWSTARCSTPLQAVVRTKVANPVIIVDEVEKAGESRHNGNLHDALLTLTERTTSRCIHDPYLETQVDLSAVNWLATANDEERLTAPLRDRFRILRVPSPRPEHLASIARSIVSDIRRKRSAESALMPDLAPDELELLRKVWRGGSMRGLTRAIETLVAGRDRLATRN